jgi:hypothetical protein
MRRTHPRWGARRIAFELDRAGTATPSRATVPRILERNGLVVAQQQQHHRRYKRWQRETPMHLLQLDLVGGIFLADGRECKMLTGIDDHSRFMHRRRARVGGDRDRTPGVSTDPARIRSVPGRRTDP